jgi:hypothetical protein
MTWQKVLLFFVMVLTLSAAQRHKFYVSTTNIEYNAQVKSLEIICTLFTDDLEAVLQQRYEPTLKLDRGANKARNESFIKRYILSQLSLTADQQVVPLEYLGLVYENDQVKIYIEGPRVDNFETLFVANKMLFDLSTEQQNVIHVKHRDQRKSLLLFNENPNGLLNFN